MKPPIIDSYVFTNNNMIQIINVNDSESIRLEKFVYLQNLINYSLNSDIVKLNENFQIMKEINFIKKEIFKLFFTVLSCNALLKCMD